MIRLLVLVEGDSEELFVKNMLSPHLAHWGVFARATGVVSKRLASGQKLTGGNLWPNVQSSLVPLLADSAAWVTTVLDFYGLPDDFPGVSHTRVNSFATARDRALAVEGALFDVFAKGEPARRFIPFVALHEFEAWYFADPQRVADHFGQPRVAELMQQANASAGGPEGINHGKDTHPSQRLESYRMRFRKTSAVAVLQDIGLPAIRAACPHFNAWLLRLESLGAIGSGFGA
jgi:hypothetical protein